jgi:hypothetical protein
LCGCARPWPKVRAESVASAGYDAGAATIAEHFTRDPAVAKVPAVATIWRILSRRGFVTPQPQKRPRSSWKRFEPTCPTNAGKPPAYEHRPSDVVMTDVTGATAMSLTPTGSGDVVEQLNGAAASFAWWWPVAALGTILGAPLMPWGLIVWAAFVPLCIWLFLRDRAARTVVLFYDVNDAHGSWFDSLVTQRLADWIAKALANRAVWPDSDSLPIQDELRSEQPCRENPGCGCQRISMPACPVLAVRGR